MPGISSHGVVVGVDDSRGSGAALAFAMSEAALRGSAVDIITAWSVSGHDDGDSPEMARRGAQQIQDAAVALALSEVDARPVLYRQVVEGDAGAVLSRSAKDAAYLVVGASTSGHNTRVPLGGVSDYCLRYAPCAVMVVPPAHSVASSTQAKEPRWIPTADQPLASSAS
jgi:nucleotide-binding universal stress UspA family protein